MRNARNEQSAGCADNVRGGGHSRGPDRRGSGCLRGGRVAGGARAKLVSVAVSLALCVGLFPAYASAEVAGATGVTDETSMLASWVEQLTADSEEAIQRVEDADGNVSALFDASTFSSSSSDTMLLSASEVGTSGNEVFPETYDLRDGDTNGFGKSLVTSVKDQTPWRTCWGFGTISAAESSIISESSYWTADNLDLSELQVAWFATTALPDDSEYFPTQAGEGTHWLVDTGDGTLVDADDAIGSYRLDSGGTTTLATSVLASGTGPLLEEYAAYGGGVADYWIDTTTGEEHWSWSYEGDWSLDEEVRYWYSFELEGTNILPDAAGNNEEGVEAIKGELMEGRAATVAYCSDLSMPGQESDSTYLNTDTWAHYTYEEVPYTHLVSIVGWDDTYSKYMFEPKLTTEDGALDPQYFVDGDTSKGLNAEGQAIADASDRIPETDGAWIVKNSWGAVDEESPNYYDWGVDGSGYFYLSYYDLSLGMVETLEFDLDASEAETEGIVIDQYDLMPSLGYDALYASDLEDTEEVSMANVFEASENQMIRTVGIVTSEPDTTVEVQVYLLDDDAEGPTDGKALLDTPATATFDYGGYHRIDLRDYGVMDENLVVEEGQQFSVVATLLVGGDSYVTSGLANSEECLVEPDDGVYWYSEGVVNEGESYAGSLPTGSSTYEWEDWSEIVEQTEEEDPEITYDNLAIKAYSDPMTITVSTADELEAALDSVIDGYTIVLDADITVDDQIAIDKAITLDLGGYTLTSTYENAGGTGVDRFSLIAAADGVTIQNGAYVVGASADTGTGGIIGSVGDLTLSGMTVEGGLTAVSSSAVGGTLTIEGCMISSRYAVGSDGDGNKVVVSNSTLTGEWSGIVSASDGGTLTIEDSEVYGDYAVWFYAIGSTVTIDNSTLKGTSCGLYRGTTAYPGATTSYSSFTLTATDSTFIGEDGSSGNVTGVCIAGTAETYAAVGCHQASFDNCAITGDTGIEVQYTDLTLTDCTVTATQDEVSYEQGTEGTLTYGFAVVSTDNSAVGETPQPKGTITITGDDGMYTGRMGLTGLLEETYPDFEDATYVISGGYFTWEFPEAYLAAGYELIEEGEGYRVQPASYASYWTLAFETNGGSAVESVTVEDGTTVDLSAYTTTRDGYTFNGWYVDSDLTTQVTSVTLTADTTVYAGWTQDSADSGDSGSDGSSTDESDSDGSTDGSDEGDSADSTLAKTGDETPWAPLCVLAALAGCVLVGALVARRRSMRK